MMTTAYWMTAPLPRQQRRAVVGFPAQPSKLQNNLLCLLVCCCCWMVTLGASTSTCQPVDSFTCAGDFASVTNATCSFVGHSETTTMCSRGTNMDAFGSTCTLSGSYIAKVYLVEAPSTFPEWPGQTSSLTFTVTALSDDMQPRLSFQTCLNIQENGGALELRCGSGWSTDSEPRVLRATMDLWRHQRIWIFVTNANTSSSCGTFYFSTIESSSVELTVSPTPMPTYGPRKEFQWNHAASETAGAIGILLAVIFVHYVGTQDPNTWILFSLAVTLAIFGGVFGLAAGIDVRLAYPSYSPERTNSSAVDDVIIQAENSIIPLFMACTCFVLTFLCGVAIKSLCTTYVVYDLEKEMVVSLPSFRFRNANSCIVSWRWDIDTAQEYLRSATLVLCFTRARELGFRYVLVDVVTLNQASISPRSVLRFAQLYATMPVLVAVQDDAAAHAYVSRFWTNVEMFRFRANPRVHSLMGGKGASSVVKGLKGSFSRIRDIVISPNITATFDLDRIRVLVFTLPFNLALLGHLSRYIELQIQQRRDVARMQDLHSVIDVLETGRILFGAWVNEMADSLVFAHAAGGPARIFAPIIRIALAILWLAVIIFPPNPLLLCRQGRGEGERITFSILRGVYAVFGMYLVISAIVLWVGISRNELNVLWTGIVYTGGGLVFLFVCKALAVVYAGYRCKWILQDTVRTTKDAGTTIIVSSDGKTV